MESVIRTLLGSIQLGDPVGDRGLTILPVLGEFTGVPPLVTLGEALAAGTLTITEVSLGGSVPDLKARNTAAVGVLIVDGEELAGAKQNRVLNTSVYIGPWQEVVIPVSCTEHGRWSYQSTAFSDSGHLSAVAVRMAAHDSVTRSARRGGGFRSDQGRVWEEVALLQERHRVASPTAAARDVYEARDETVRRRETAFTRVPGQLGLLALWSGRVVGLDVLGTSAAYARLHERFVRSYALDAPGGGPASVEADRRTAKEWLAGLAGSTVTVHESPGKGWPTASPARERWDRCWRWMGRSCMLSLSPPRRRPRAGSGSHDPRSSVIPATSSAGTASPGRARGLGGPGPGGS